MFLPLCLARLASIDFYICGDQPSSPQLQLLLWLLITTAIALPTVPTLRQGAAHLPPRKQIGRKIVAFYRTRSSRSRERTPHDGKLVRTSKGQRGGKRLAGTAKEDDCWETGASSISVAVAHEIPSLIQSHHTTRFPRSRRLRRDGRLELEGGGKRLKLEGEAKRLQREVGRRRAIRVLRPLSHRHIAINRRPASAGRRNSQWGQRSLAIFL